MSNSESIGTFVLSIDAELAWGFHDLLPEPENRVNDAREAWNLLLSLLDRFDIPATWAIVGHLFLDECDGTHSDHPAPRDWFARDPGGQATPDSLWFGLDLIQIIRNTDVDHEIGSHSFSHVEFGDRATTEEIATAELCASVEAANAADISLDSFVFPRNNVGHCGLLANHGFSCYRGLSPRWLDTSLLRPALKLAVFPTGVTSPPLVEPRIDKHGLVNVPASLGIFGFEGKARRILTPLVGDPIVRQAKLGIDAAIQKGGVFHCWLHPHDIVTTADAERLRAIFAYVNQRRDDGLRVETMSEIASRVRNDHSI